MWEWAKIVAGVVNLANTVAAFFKTKQDQDAGIAKQVAADQTANSEAATNATIIRERNAARSRDDLVKRLHEQTGVDP